ncbi:hypothetical protein [Rhodococcus sp. NPDC059234]|uniref:hypothetical protein n=1 Tax=Rhodococcus sp. NPDC059234 TaxID=3346781 RepID=UPI00367126A2
MASTVLATAVLAGGLVAGTGTAAASASADGWSGLDPLQAVATGSAEGGSSARFFEDPSLENLVFPLLGMAGATLSLLLQDLGSMDRPSGQA